MKDKTVDDETIENVEKSIEKINKEGLTTNNLDHLYKLSKIKHLAKEDKEMYGNYGNYEGYGARRPGYDSYGRDEYGRGGYGNYGARGRDRRYRGDEYMGRMYDEYGRYQESRERYGAGDQETDKSFMYMVKALEDFIKVLEEEAESPAQKQQLRQALQNSMR